jgi:hypothetical protein
MKGEERVYRSRVKDNFNELLGMDDLGAFEVRNKSACAAC